MTLSQLFTYLNPTADVLIYIYNMRYKSQDQFKLKTTCVIMIIQSKITGYLEVNVTHYVCTFVAKGIQKLSRNAFLQLVFVFRSTTKNCIS